jgi:hypothetical protein
MFLKRLREIFLIGIFISRVCGTLVQGLQVDLNAIFFFLKVYFVYSQNKTGLNMYLFFKALSLNMLVL